MFQKWKVNERKIARELKGKRQPFSGADWFAKGDVETSSFLVEVKTTGNQSYSVKLSILKKIELEALQAYKLPALVTIISDKSYVTVPMRVFKMLVEVWEDVKNTPKPPTVEEPSRIRTEAERISFTDEKKGNRESSRSESTPGGLPIVWKSIFPI